jgi:hypothetical protein
VRNVCAMPADRVVVVAIRVANAQQDRSMEQDMRKNTAQLVLGVITLMIGGAIAIMGGVVSAVSGPDDTIRTGHHRLVASSRALMARAADISPGAIPDGIGRITIRIDAHSTAKPLFIGVAPDRAVESYLSGAAVKTVRGLELWPYRLHTADVSGTGTPAPPQKEAFWSASASGTSPQLTWQVADGGHRLVIMNSDTSTEVAADVRFAVTIPWLFDIALATLVLGLLIASGGVVLLLFAGTRPRTA